LPERIHPHAWAALCFVDARVRAAGRNRRCAEEFVKAGGRKSFEQIEKELLNGQKLQGTLTVKEVMAILRKEGAAGACGRRRAGGRAGGGLAMCIGARGGLAPAWNCWRARALMRGICLALNPKPPTPNPQPYIAHSWAASVACSHLCRSVPAL